MAYQNTKLFGQQQLPDFWNINFVMHQGFHIKSWILILHLEFTPNPQNQVIFFDLKSPAVTNEAWGHVIQIISTFAPANKNPNTSPKTRMCKHDLPNLNFWLLSFWGPFFTQISSTTQPQIQPHAEDLYLQPSRKTTPTNNIAPCGKRKLIFQIAGWKGRSF